MIAANGTKRNGNIWRSWTYAPILPVMSARKPQLKVSNIVMACIVVALMLVAALFLVVGPNPGAFLNPDACYDARGAMISCED